ncbi:hypothetical protein [Fodinicurvata sediminis]|uniref:hypothetical protein n=1 Tax=Fodinicurvata sediminis TaxID=1121832 RepID=UPI0003B40E59|nr:hypothetical protein [Fodinicurvata sediminis]
MPEEMSVGDEWKFTTTIPLYERIDLEDKEGLQALIRMIDFARNNKHLHEQLNQLSQQGPLWDGDVICKADRGDLLKIGACVKVCVRGEQGYNACSYYGHELLGIYDWLYGRLGKNLPDDQPQLADNFTEGGGAACDPEWPHEGAQYFWLNHRGRPETNIWRNDRLDRYRRDCFLGIFKTHALADNAARTIKRIMERLRVGDSVTIARGAIDEETIKL